MENNTNKQKGRIGLSKAIDYYTVNGYTVSIPINDTQWYDLIIEKDGKLKTVQCKCTSTKRGEISLNSTGGTKGSPYAHISDHPELDILFCVDGNYDIWEIPLKDLLSNGNLRSIMLRRERNKHSNKCIFDTSRYFIKLND